MNEAIRIADRLVLGADLSSAGLLVALSAREPVDLLPEDKPALDLLDRLGCVSKLTVTPLGARVAIALQARQGLRPHPMVET